jgi:hypothetical protein
METPTDCPKCLLEIWTPAAICPDSPGFCNCPTLEIDDYLYSEEDSPEEIT